MPERQILSLDEFKRRALSEKDGKRPGTPPPGSFLIRSGFTVAAQPVPGEDRRITFVVATGEVNRNGWRLNPQGWELAAYAKCPVMLWAHDDAKLPIANAEKVWVDGDLLKVTSLFTPATMSAFNDTVFEMYRQGFLHAVSAGWIPLEWEFVETETGWEIMCARQELVEISFVPVPAEPNALRQAAKAGIDIGPLRAWARGLAGEPRYAMHVAQDPTREKAEQIRFAFAEFYPGAKLLFVPSGMTLCALEDLAAVKNLDLDEFEREVAVITGDRVTAGVSPSEEPPEFASVSAGTSAPETDKSSPTPAPGIPAVADEPDAISVALARYNRRIKVLEL